MALFVVGLGGGFARLTGPLGDGDMLAAYATALGWSEGSPSGASTLGFPFGTEMRYYPTTDVLQNVVAGLVGAISGSPFLGLNVVFALSFPLTAVCALWLLHLLGIRGHVSVALALAITFIPYHWLRVEHIYLATMYSAVIAVALAVAIGRGMLRRRPGWRLSAKLAALAAVIALSGIYYACFAMILMSVAAIYTFARGSSWRAVVRALCVPLVVLALTAAALAPGWLYQREQPALDSVAGRQVMESVQYSGVLALTILPAPHELIAGALESDELFGGVFAQARPVTTSGVVWVADSGSWLTFAALGFVVVGGIVVARRSAQRDERHRTTVARRSRADLGLLVVLLATAVLFYVPWGLNFLFAGLVTPQLRGWDRLVPVLLTLVIAAGAVTWKALMLPSVGWRGVCAAATLMLVVVADSVMPYRAYFDDAAAAGSASRDAGQRYANELNAAVPGDCGVLQLPYFTFPEGGGRGEMSSYAHLWPALTNPEKRWSFGAMRATVAGAWQARLGNTLDATAVGNLAAGGFCVVHVDRRGFDAPEFDELVRSLTDVLGPPVAVGDGGAWTAFAVPEWHAASEPESVSGEVALFFRPPVVSGVDPLTQHPVFDGTQTYWWLDSVDSAVDINSIVDGIEFSAVTGSLIAAECTDRVVTMTLTSGEQQSSVQLALVAGERRDFELRLPRPAGDAELVLAPDGSPCITPEDARHRSVALVDVSAGP